jgi:hypothetical protein
MAFLSFYVATTAYQTSNSNKTTAVHTADSANKQNNMNI